MPRRTAIVPRVFRPNINSVCMQLSYDTLLWSVTGMYLFFQTVPSDPKQSIKLQRNLPIQFKRLRYSFVDAQRVFSKSPDLQNLFGVNGWCLQSSYSLREGTTIWEVGARPAGSFLFLKIFPTKDQCQFVTFLKMF